MTCLRRLLRRTLYKLLFRPVRYETQKKIEECRIHILLHHTPLRIQLITIRSHSDTHYQSLHLDHRNMGITLEIDNPQLHELTLHHHHQPFRAPGDRTRVYR